MRTQFVIVATKPIEGTLLGARRRRRRLSRLPLQGTMHALMAPVLFRMSGLNAFRANAQLHPPQRQPRHTVDGARRKGRSVVAANGLGQAIFAEGRSKNRLHPLRVGLLYCL